MRVEIRRTRFRGIDERRNHFDILRLPRFARPEVTQCIMTSKHRYRTSHKRTLQTSRCLNLARTWSRLCARAFDARQASTSCRKSTTASGQQGEHAKRSATSRIIVWVGIEVRDVRLQGSNCHNARGTPPENIASHAASAWFVRLSNNRLVHYDRQYHSSQFVFQPTVTEDPVLDILFCGFVC